MIDEPCTLGGSELVQVLLQNTICSSRVYPNDLNCITIPNPADTHVRIRFPMRIPFLLFFPETFHSLFQGQTDGRSKLTGKHTREHEKLDNSKVSKVLKNYTSYHQDEED